MVVIVLGVIIQCVTSGVAFLDDIILQKKAMKESYHLDFKFECKDPHAVASQPKVRSYAARIWRSGNKFRVDVFDRKQDVPFPDSSGVARHVICVNCERENYVISTKVYPSPTDVTHAVQFAPLQSEFRPFANLDADWRYLGLSNSELNVFHRVKFGSGFDKLKTHPKLRLDTETRGGVRCTVATVQKDYTSRTWFADAVRHNPIFFELDLNKDGKARRYTTEVEWQPTPGGHLYPGSIRNLQLVDGHLDHEERLTVTHADFHTPVDPAVFTLAGFGLNDNQLIAYPGLEESRMPRWRDGKADESLSDETRWKAQHVAQPPIAASASVVAAYPTESKTPLIVSIVSGTLAVAALVVALVYRRRKAGV